MPYFDNQHKEKIKKMDVLWHSFAMMSEVAKEYGIDDIFQDNNAKLVQQLTYLNFKALPGREGNDAVDENSVEWEMKSANQELVSGFSTHHHLNNVILAKYRKIPWAFSIYSHTVLKEIYIMTNKKLEPIFLNWEKKLKTVTSINNPKIPLKFVRENGVNVFPFPKNPINPADLVKPK